MSYSDVLTIPTFERKYFIDKLSTEFQEKNEQYEKQRQKSR